MKTKKVGGPIVLKPSKCFLKAVARQGSVCDWVAWEKSLAFAANPRGFLLHRVRHVDTILWHGKERHHHVSYLCGNGCNVSLDAIGEVLVADPPEGRLLCVRCEQSAQRESLPSGDQLAGRHVHQGVMVPRQVCCGHKQE